MLIIDQKAVTQRKLIETISDSSKVSQLKTLQVFASNAHLNRKVTQLENGDNENQQPQQERNPANYMLPLTGLWLTTNRAIISRSFTPFMYYAMGQAHEAGAWFNLGRNMLNLTRHNPLAFGSLALGLFGMGMRYRQSGRLTPEGSTSE